MALSMAFSNARADGAKPLRKGEAHLSAPQSETVVSDHSDTQADLVRKMAAVLTMERPDTTAEALRLLRQEFPDYPLALRLVALAASMRTWP